MDQSDTSSSSAAELVPFGQIATRQWLLAQGQSRHTLDNALKSGKLVAVARGVVARPGLPLTWEGIAVSLHRMLKGQVYIGGLTALEKSGQGHYLRTAEQVAFYSPLPQPRWLPSLKSQAELQWHGTARLWEFATLQAAQSLKELPWMSAVYLLATPEQAYLETLADVPGKVSFEHADALMQGLTTLSPRRLEVLLQGCRHIKAKRLFFFFASRHNHAWLKHLDSKHFNLGSGKRVVVKGGKLNSQYLITVPESFHGSE
jgi:hypothetical protein